MKRRAIYFAFGTFALLCSLAILKPVFVTRESEGGGTGLEYGDMTYIFSNLERFYSAKFLFDSAERAKAFAVHERNVTFSKEIHEMGMARAIQLGIVGEMKGDIWDSLRHAHWAIEIARKMGPQEALIFLQEYHERTGNSTNEEFLQDYYTHFAAILYDCQKGMVGSAREVVLEMKNKGLLHPASDFSVSKPKPIFKISG